MPADVTFNLHGTAGQSFGAFAVDGMKLVLDGQANDFVGKGLSGGELVIRARGLAARDSGQHVILGNVALYGATSGLLFAAGRAGERFAVRNSGATAVVEGVGDHGCEYMTGGTVVVMGRAGMNFGAGMTGGLAWVYDADGSFVRDGGRFHPDFVTVDSFAEADEAAREGLRALVEPPCGGLGQQPGRVDAGGLAGVGGGVCAVDAEASGLTGTYVSGRGFRMKYPIWGLSGSDDLQRGATRSWMRRRSP